MFNKVVQGWINYYGRFYKSRLYRFSSASTGISCDGPRGSTNGCAATRDRPSGGWCVSRDASRSCLRTGGWACVLKAGQWEPCESRGSSTVLREPRGETPLGYSPGGSLQERVASPLRSGRHRATAGAVWSGSASRQNAHCVLQGRVSPSYLCQRAVRLPGVHLSSSSFEEQGWQAFCQLLAGGE